MATIDLKFGETAVPFEYDEDRFDVLAGDDRQAPLTDVEIGERFDSPIDSPPIEEIVEPGETILLVVPDATRETGSGQIVNLLVRRLIANGTAPHEIAVIFATGIHRAVTEDERQRLLTPFIAQRIKTIHHRAADPIRNFRVGEIAGGLPVELDWTLTEYDRVVLVGGISFHYFAGFTGGRKLICPGLASARTVSETHRLAFDCAARGRRSGVGTGLLDGNPVHEAFTEAAALVAPAFAISTIVNDEGEIVDLFCGHWKTSHRAACDVYAAARTVSIQDKRELVVASCGGYPHDINMIQAHKALEAAAQACMEGGTIVLLAECRDGLGRGDFLDWFAAGDSSALADRLCADYKVNGQTAWSLLRKAEKFDVRVMTSLEDEVAAKMRLRKLDSLEGVGSGRTGYILPTGAKIRVA